MSNTLSNSLWYGQLEVCLRVGTADSSLLMHLDDILSWYSSVLNTDTEMDDWSTEIYNRYGDTDLRIRFEDFLDRLVISNVVAYQELFPRELQPLDAKWKFRKLMSVFHPDKGRNNLEWLNFRAEKINSSYANYLEKSAESLEMSGTATGQNQVDISSNSARRRRRSRVGADNRVLSWRDRIGSPAVVQRRALAVISIACMIMILSLIASVLING